MQWMIKLLSSLIQFYIEQLNRIPQKKKKNLKLIEFSVAGHYRAEPTKALIHNASKHCITLTTDSIRRMLVEEGSKIKITVCTT